MTMEGRERVSALLGAPLLGAYPVGMSIVTYFGKIERTCYLTFQGGSKTTCVNGKVPPTKKFTRVTKTSVSGGGCCKKVKKKQKN